MKIDNRPIITMPMRMHDQVNISNVKNLKNQTPSHSKNNGNLRDVVELSISGRNRGQKLTIPTGKKKTAGLIIKNLKIGGEYGLEESKALDKEIVTVANDKSGLGASENRLGGNTRNIDNPKELVDKIRPAMFKEPVNAILAQGNTNPHAVMHLLR